MKILISSLVDIRSAANNRIHNFIDYLQEEHEITVVCPRDTWRPTQVDTENYSDITSGQNINVTYLTNREVSPILQDVFSRLLIQNLEIDYESYDVHLDYNSLFLGKHIRGKLQSYNIPSILDLADDLPAMIRDSPQLPSYLGLLGSKVGNYLLEDKIDKYQRVTYITEGIRSNHKIPKLKSRKVPNGVDISKFDPSGLSESSYLKGIKHVVGYVGVNREWVDLPLLLRSIAELRDRGVDVGLLIVGDEGGIDKSEKIARELEIEEAVKFTGTVPYEEVPKLVNTMDVGTIPFKSGGIAENSLPLKLFEYLACEVPVVSSNIPGVKSAVGDCVKIAETESEWTDVLQMLAEDRPLRNEMGSAGRDLVENEYSWESISSTMEATLMEAGDFN